MDSLEGSHIVSSVDAVVLSVNVEAFDNSLEDLRMVDDSFLHEVEQLFLGGDTFLGEVVELDGQLVVQLSLLGEEIGVISIIEVLGVFGKRVEEPVLGPSSHSITGESSHLDFNEFSSSEQHHPS